MKGVEMERKNQVRQSEMRDIRALGVCVETDDAFILFHVKPPYEGIVFSSIRHYRLDLSLGRAAQARTRTIDSIRA
ncbi:hypothetical protein PHSY_003179 [Pseudozyma hubeiensis SY62]|uniref:Uncharacterized protein n=1 Tax=Pseudozyma hubeiensis (strain SY62) TaxID=1305764 RepID=R9P2H4_PSEHS|nr:hypothetical protein PHSY_003179 [Pseudozyma hubeiensis SY62]GAC95603.1 hypothetical protein PHSY_003179 [Pseudozyma hubeiensis SY62]